MKYMKIIWKILLGVCTIAGALISYLSWNTESKNNFFKTMDLGALIFALFVGGTILLFFWLIDKKIKIERDETIKKIDDERQKTIKEIDSERQKTIEKNREEFNKLNIVTVTTINEIKEEINNLKSKIDKIERVEQSTMGFYLLNNATIIQLIREIIIPEIYKDRNDFLKALENYPYFNLEGVKIVFGGYFKNDVVDKIEIIIKESELNIDKQNIKIREDELSRLKEMLKKRQENENNKDNNTDK